MRNFINKLTLVALGNLIALAVYADHPIAKPKIYQNKVETAIIWVEKVTMAPMPTANKDAHIVGVDPTVNPKKVHLGVIHNEIDQHAIKGDKMGFGAGGWLADCEVACVIHKRHSKWSTVFSMMSMVANDGPHYGRNVQLDGPGVYEETCEIDPPDWRGFFRHTDKESGVGPFFKPYTISGSFRYMGSGKAGGY